MYINEERGAEVTVDILKSIVYGGLIESITSLGVVSSAAGAGSATCKHSFPGCYSAVKINLLNRFI